MKLLKKTIYFLLLAHIIFILAGKFINPIITVTQFNGWQKYGKLERNYIDYSEMGDPIKKAVIASEDQLFFIHNGFDYESIKKAAMNNKTSSKIKGGSTISQQTAKNVFLWQSRTWVRKGLEMVYTFIIEKIWGKEVILERYLNTIEMGQGVFGIEAASNYYFGKHAKDLSKSEAAWIASILPNPAVYDPNHPTRNLKRKHAWILKQMKTIHLPKNN